MNIFETYGCLDRCWILTTWNERSEKVALVLQLWNMSWSNCDRSSNYSVNCCKRGQRHPLRNMQRTWADMSHTSSEAAFLDRWKPCRRTCRDESLRKNRDAKMTTISAEDVSWRKLFSAGTWKPHECASMEKVGRLRTLATFRTDFWLRWIWKMWISLLHAFAAVLLIYLMSSPQLVHAGPHDVTSCGDQRTETLGHLP